MERPCRSVTCGYCVGPGFGFFWDILLMLGCAAAEGSGVGLSTGGSRVAARDSWDGLPRGSGIRCSSAAPIPSFHGQRSRDCLSSIGFEARAMRTGQGGTIRRCDSAGD